MLISDGTGITRRTFVKRAGHTAAAAAITSTATAVFHATARAQPPKPRQFRVWAFGCSHVGTDMRVGKRESLAEAIRQSEHGGDEGGPPFDWDVALDLGDLSGTQQRADDEEGREVVRQFSAATKHARGDIYDLAGNHDASLPDEPSMEWFKTWVDPTGERPSTSGVDPKERRFATDGTWERYTFRAGNLVVLMMSDRNDGGPPVGRGMRGGYPSGAVSGDTFRWWQEMVEAHPDAIILSAHHHMLKETTVASGPWEGYRKDRDGAWQSHYHGYFPDGGPEGASYLYYVDGKPDAQAFESYLAAHPGAVDLWLGGHTHTNPDDTRGGRSHIERKWDTNFINAAALAKHHANKTTVPISRVLTFTEGSDELLVQCYLHTSQHAAQGWYDKVERVLKLSKPFVPPA